MKNLAILERGFWTPELLTVKQIAKKENLMLFDLDSLEIKKRWEMIKDKNPRLSPDPTIRLAGHHRIGNQLVLEVLPSNYKEGLVLGWLGSTMILVTTDEYVVLQECPETTSTVLGKGIRVPGCTLKNTMLFKNIVREMKEEFCVEINENNITVHGLTEIRPPLGSLRKTLIAKIKLPLSKNELQKSWEIAKDKWEGSPIFVKLKKNISFKNIGGIKKINPYQLLMLAIAIESETMVDYVKRWINFWL
ncbi:hypothetical protein AMJ47_00325 [Parcubacteria bacterium DG_72]|nr:MAG: hypothetical protein AMJ47_00325 [Parcubacteria bacterium DG_72]